MLVPDANVKPQSADKAEGGCWAFSTRGSSSWIPCAIENGPGGGAAAAAASAVEDSAKTRFMLVGIFSLDVL